MAVSDAVHVVRDYALVDAVLDVVVPVVRCLISVPAEDDDGAGQTTSLL